ncbi:MAG: methyltransferase domain-containing protein [Candidatus Micrarchaeota archaeon]
MQAYDEIAHDWDKARTRPISALSLFIADVKKTDAVLDAGCGNARNLVEIARKCAKIVGVDSSDEMLSFAAARIGKAKLRKKASLEHGDIRALPFDSGEFDKVFCIAVLHHLARREQLKAVRELSRVLKPDGAVYLTVWNRDQKKFDGRGKEIDSAWTAKGGRKVPRYYYLFSEAELRLLARRAGLKVARVAYEKDGQEHDKRGAKNLCLKAAKPTV